MWYIGKHCSLPSIFHKIESLFQYFYEHGFAIKKKETLAFFCTASQIHSTSVLPNGHHFPGTDSIVCISFQACTAFAYDDFRTATNRCKSNRYNKDIDNLTAARPKLRFYGDIIEYDRAIQVFELIFSLLP